MATGLLALLDDITSILDDVSAMTKVAADKTAGVIGDDLALNAQQVTEVRADRELPVVWAVAKGSALNKAILVPTALAISAFAPWLVTPLLMLGGAYLCFEGVEKLAHPWLHEAAPGPPAPLPSEDERAKMRAAVRTDFVLSAEIIVITLGTVAGQPLATQIGVMVGIAALMTVGVYGLVAGIVRLDDIGLYLAVPGRGEAAARPRDPGGGAVSDADPVPRRNGGDVPGRRRHPDARVPRRAGGDRPSRRTDGICPAARRRAPTGGGSGRRGTCRGPRRRSGVRGAARWARRVDCTWDWTRAQRARALIARSWSGFLRRFATGIPPAPRLPFALNRQM